MIFSKNSRKAPHLLSLLVAFAVAVVWISKKGGWKGEGCGGNSASCHHHCDTPDQKKH